MNANSGDTLDLGFHRITALLAEDKEKAVDLAFDQAESDFQFSWQRISNEVAAQPAEALNAAKQLIAAQPLALSLTLAISRCDAVNLFRRWQRLLESMVKATERSSLDAALVGVPHLQAGFLYMSACTFALRWESWKVLEKLLSAKFEWNQQSGRASFSFPFELLPFFHPAVFGRSAYKTHDFYREQLGGEEIARATRLTGDELLDVYLQVQLLMSLRTVQLAEKGEGGGIWPDFGRYYAERVLRLLDRAYADREYAQGMLRSFQEDPDTFFSKLNERLELILSRFWKGERFAYQSVSRWSPQGTGNQ
jgi:hypothetical protein